VRWGRKKEGGSRRRKVLSELNEEVVSLRTWEDVPLLFGRRRRRRVRIRRPPKGSLRQVCRREFRLFVDLQVVKNRTHSSKLLKLQS